MFQEGAVELTSVVEGWPPADIPQLRLWYILPPVSDVFDGPVRRRDLWTSVFRYLLTALPALVSTR